MMAFGVSSQAEILRAIRAHASLFQTAPGISQEVQPLTAAFAEELRQLLGGSRGKVLLDQAGQYSVEYVDRLGLLPREFIRPGNALIIRYPELRGRPLSSRYQRGESVAVPTTREMEYGHLFGPGAPCELKETACESEPPHVDRYTLRTSC